MISSKSKDLLLIILWSSLSIRISEKCHFRWMKHLKVKVCLGLDWKSEQGYAKSTLQCLSHDDFMVIIYCWLTVDFLMIIKLLYDDNLMNILLSCVQYLLIVSTLSDYNFITIWWLSVHHQFIILSLCVEYLLMVCSLVENHLMNICWSNYC